jgi:hypothetical protein
MQQVIHPEPSKMTTSGEVDLQELASLMRRNIEIKDRTYHFKKYSKVSQDHFGSIDFSLEIPYAMYARFLVFSWIRGGTVARVQWKCQ